MRVFFEQSGGLVHSEHRVKNAFTLEVTHFSDIVDTGKNLAGFLAKYLINFCWIPNKKLTFLTVTVGVLCRVEAAFVVQHLPEQVIQGLLHHPLKKLIPRSSIDLGQDSNQLCVVIEHLLEMRHEPSLIDRITMKPTAEVIINSASSHLSDCMCDHVQKTLCFCLMIVP